MIELGLFNAELDAELIQEKITAWSPVYIFSQNTSVYGSEFLAAYLVLGSPRMVQLVHNIGYR